MLSTPANGVSLQILPGGANGGNLLWDVMLTPESPSSVGVAIALEFNGGSIISIDTNELVFDTDLPSHNPFTGMITKGVSIHDVIATNDGAFAGLGGSLNSIDDVKVFTVETDAPGTLTLGGQDHNGAYIGARVSQQGLILTGSRHL